MWPAAGTDVLQPHVVGHVVLEVVFQSFHQQAGHTQDGGELPAEVAIGEEGRRQAAPSYATAGSISSSCRP